MVEKMILKATNKSGFDEVLKILKEKHSISSQDETWLKEIHQQGEIDTCDTLGIS